MRQETVSGLGPLDIISGIQRCKEYSQEEENSNVVFENPVAEEITTAWTRTQDKETKCNYVDQGVTKRCLFG
jgi:hypothetical protein